VSPSAQIALGIVAGAIGGVWLWLIRLGLFSWLSTVSWRKRPPPRWLLLMMGGSALALASAGLVVAGAGLIRLLV
jgi:hypothetical protein